MRHISAKRDDGAGLPPVDFTLEDANGAKESFAGRPTIPGTIALEHDALLAGTSPMGVKGGAMLDLIRTALQGVYVRWEDGEPILETAPDPNDPEDKRRDEWTRFREFTDDPAREIDTVVIGQVWRYLLEEYGRRPTLRPLRSADGPTQTEAG